MNDDYNKVRNQRVADVASPKGIQHRDESAGRELPEGILPRSGALQKAPTDHTQSGRR